MTEENLYESAARLSRRALIERAAATGSSLAVASALGLHGISGSSARAQDATPAPIPGGTLSLGYTGRTSWSHFMHMRFYSGSENVYNRAFVQSKLLARTLDLTSFEPDLAEKWEFSPEGDRITFTLRPSLTWHDGQPFSAADVDFTLHMVGIPGLGGDSPGSYFKNLVVGYQDWIDGTVDRIAGVTIEDDLTISLQLTSELNPTVVLTAFNVMCIAPNHILSDFLNRDISETILQSEWATTASHVGMGPFRVVEYVPDQYVVYEPFEGYYRGRPLLDQLIFRGYLDAQTTSAALENRELDVARLPASDFERFQGLDFLHLETPKIPSMQGVMLNSRQPYLDLKVRQALIHAVDREAIINVLQSGIGDVVHSPLWVPQIEDNPDITKYAYDPDRAKTLLSEAGWDSDRKLRWCVSEVVDNPFYAAINGYFEAVGVKTEFQAVGADLLSVTGPPNYDFDLILSAFPIGAPPEIAQNYDPRQVGTATSGYDTPELVALWDAYSTRQSDEDLQATVWRLQAIISEQALGLWISTTPDLWGISNRVQNVHPMYIANNAYQYDWEIEQTWVTD